LLFLFCGERKRGGAEREREKKKEPGFQGTERRGDTEKARAPAKTAEETSVPRNHYNLARSRLKKERKKPDTSKGREGKKIAVV